MRLDLIDLRLFLHVVDAASITHGAGRANLALASASARIRGMEDALGVALLERGPRGVRPTPAGRALAQHARIVAQQLERMRGELAAYTRGLKSHVRMLANTAALSEFLPEALAAFLAAHPHVDIDLEERLSYEVVQAVAEGLVDIGIVADSVDLGTLETLPFRLDRLVLVMPRRHALARRRQIAFRDVLDEAFVGLGQASALRQHLGQHAARAGRRLKLRVRVGSFDAICRMVERGVGLGIIPEAAARRCGAAMAVRAVRLTDSWALRQLKLCMRRRDELPMPAQELIDHLSSRAAAPASARSRTARVGPLPKATGR